jgi:hypothetical protein
MIFLKIKSDVAIGVNYYIKYAFENYGLLIAFLVIGFLLGWYGKILLSDRKYQKQIELRFKEKDERISEYKVLISERLSKVEVKKEDASFFKRVKKFFKPKK